MQSINLKGLVCLVTGASKPNGIGRALVEKALKEGAKKVYATARDIQDLDPLVQKYPDQVIPLKLDLTDKDQITEVANRAKDTQVLFNNAGSGSFSGLTLEYNEELARRDFAVNYWGSVHMMQVFSEEVIKNRGALVNIISVGALYPNPALAPYSASKAALRSATQVARIELYKKRVPVFAAYPGPIATKMAEEIKGAKGTPSSVAESIIEGMKIGKLDLTTDDFSRAFEACFKENKEIKAALMKFKEDRNFNADSKPS